MPTIITRPVAGIASTANATSYAGPIIAAPTANSLLLVFVEATDTIVTATMTGGGLNWILVTRRSFGSTTQNSLYLFYAKVGASPVSTTPTFDCTGDAASGADISVLMATGYDAITLSPIKQLTHSSSGVNSTTNLNAVFSQPTSTTNALCGAMGGGLAANSVTPPTGWTEADDIAHTTPAGNIGTAYANNGQTLTSYSFGHALIPAGVIFIEIFDFGTGPFATRLGLLGVG